MGLLVVSRDFYRRSPEHLANIMRAYIERVAAIREQKQTALKTIARYTRIKEAKSIRGNLKRRRQVRRRYSPRRTQAVSATLESMGKKGVPIESFADNSIIDR